MKIRRAVAVLLTCLASGCLFPAPVPAYGGAGLPPVVLYPRPSCTFALDVDGVDPVVLHPRPGCTFTWDVDGVDFATIAEPLKPERACAADLVKSVSVTGSRADLTVVLGYSLDMRGWPIAGTPRGQAAVKSSVAAWSLVWRHAFGGVTKFTIKFQDAKDRDLCWFTFTEAAGETPVVNRCVLVVE